MDEARGQLVNSIDAMIEQARDLPDAKIIVPEYERVKRGEITGEQAARNIAAAVAEKRG